MVVLEVFADKLEVPEADIVDVLNLKCAPLLSSHFFGHDGHRDCKKSTNIAFNFLKANGNQNSGRIITTILKVDELVNSLQVYLDSGVKKVLLPINNAADLGTVLPELGIVLI